YNSPNGSVQRVHAQRALRDFEERERPSRLRQLYRSLLRRSDGRVIAYRLLSNLACKVFGSRSAVPMHSWSCDQAAFDALSAALADTGVSVEEARSAWQKSDLSKQQEDKAEEAKPRLRGASKRRKISEHQGEGSRSLHADGLPFLLGALAIQAHTSSASW